VIHGRLMSMAGLGMALAAMSTRFPAITGERGFVSFNDLNGPLEVTAREPEDTYSRWAKAEAKRARKCARNIRQGLCP